MNTEEFQGTKGAWTTENVLTYSGDFYRVKAGDLSVCNITTRNQVSARANAKLIAAAPAMLEALQNFIDIANESEGISGWHLNGEIEKWEHTELLQIAVSAVEKALGK